MTERATGRHRASQKSSSPLATLTGPLSVMGEYVGSARRTGVIIAMSSGLVASMAIPAHAVTAAPPDSSGPQTASIPVLPASGGSSSFFTAPEGGLLSLPTDLVTDDGTVAAPAAAAVDFGGGTFTVVPVASKADATTTNDAPQQAAPVTRKAIRLANTTTTTDDSTSSDSSSSDTSSSSSSSSSSASGSAVVAIAMRYEGVQYTFGGSQPGTGFDCSGFVQYVYKQLGVTLPRTTYAQYDAVKKVPRSQAPIGALVFFPGLGHVGIYLGGNTMIDAPHTGSHVQVRTIYSANVTFGVP